jgi:hypothetical protein
MTRFCVSVNRTKAPSAAKPIAPPTDPRNVSVLISATSPRAIFPPGQWNHGRSFEIRPRFRSAISEAVHAWHLDYYLDELCFGSTDAALAAAACCSSAWRSRPWPSIRRCASPKSDPDTIRLTAGWPLAMLRAMRRLVQTTATIPFASSGRRDLLFELLALQHQLRVLARSNRRLRSADRLLWLLLRRAWPRWRDALMLVQPATVDRWSRDGFSRWWPHRTRRPGRPRIAAECRHLIQQMAAENRLWGAPRIHGELLKLGIAVSERTVSRYLRECPRGSSQTWRTFIANHYDQLTFIWPESAVLGAHDIVAADGLTYRDTPLLTGAPSHGHQRAIVACDASPQRTLPARHVALEHPHDRAGRTSSGRSPPGAGQPPTRSRRMQRQFMSPSGIDLRITTLCR